MWQSLKGDDTEAKIALIETEVTIGLTKPSNMGSECRVSKAENQAETSSILELAFKYDSRVLVEQGVVAREIEVRIVG